MSINNKNFVKDEGLYFLSVWDQQEIRHIRHTHCSQTEVRDFLKLYNSEFPRFSGLEIFNEKTLDLSSDYLLINSDEKKELTLRQVLFRNFYQKLRNDIKNNPKIVEEIQELRV
jgi:hypothetical protein